LLWLANGITAAAAPRPNVILCMTDDQGWGDVGYRGHPVLKTPHLDQMAKDGLQFERFYAAAPVCSPTRGSCLTGRHPFRYGIFFANTGHMKPQELTLAEVLKKAGYRTGFFGKWHLGTLTKTVKDSNRGGPGGAKHYAPPWEHGFDVCFATEAKVPTWDPMKKPGGSGDYGTYYWDGPESRVTENLAGDDSRVIMDRAIPFIHESAKADKPFFAVIWFHTPHLPVVAGGKYREMYKDQPGTDYFGCLTAMDDQMGRLRKELQSLGVAKNTMLWFCSDNGPEGRRDTQSNGTAGPLRGRKRSLYEGGVRVPGLLVWPAQITKHRVIDVPCVTSDYFPTVVDAFELDVPELESRPYDGVSLLPLIEGRMKERGRGIGFESRGQLAWTEDRYKLIRTGNKPFELYDLQADPGERRDLADEQPEVVKQMQGKLDSWRKSCEASREGKDY